jgi:hypothetical protein
MSRKHPDPKHNAPGKHAKSGSAPEKHAKSESAEAKEGRRDERRGAHETPQLTARLVGGATVKLLNLSPRGVLLETTAGLPPGRNVSLRFIAHDAELVLTGCVVRSSVGALTGSSIVYQTAVTFGRENTLYTRLIAAVSAPAGSLVPVTSDEAVEEDLMLVVSVAGNVDGVRTVIGAIA